MELIAKKIFFTLSKMRLSFSMRKSNVMTHFYQLLRKIGRTRGSGGRAHGFRWSGARFSWRGYSVINQTRTYYILMMKSTLKNSWKKINNVVVSKNFFFTFLKMTRFVKSSPPLGLPTTSVIFCHM